MFDNMRIVFALQVMTILVQYQSIEASYGLGDYFEDDETLLIPKKSKIKFPDDDFLSDPDYISKGITAPFGLAKARWAQSLFPLDDLRARSHPLGGYAPSYGRSIGSRPVLLHPPVHPMVLVPRTNGWIRGGRLQPELVDSGIKPVTEPLPDDLKYDFRTKTHTLR